MQPFFAQRFEKVEPSFIREILKVAANPEIISFAGGLPNPHLFPVKAIEQACQDVLREQGAAALQYATTEGFASMPAKRCLYSLVSRKNGFSMY